MKVVQKVKSYGGSGYAAAGVKSHGSFFGKVSGGGYHNGGSKFGNHNQFSSGHIGNPGGHGHNHENTDVGGGRPRQTGDGTYTVDDNVKDTTVGVDSVTYKDKTAGNKAVGGTRAVTTEPWDYNEKSSGRWPSKRSYGSHTRSVGYSGNHGRVSISYRPKTRVIKKSFIGSRYGGSHWGKRSIKKPSAHRRISYSKRSNGKLSYGRRSVSKRPWGRTYW